MNFQCYLTICPSLSDSFSRIFVASLESGIKVDLICSVSIHCLKKIRYIYLVIYLVKYWSKLIQSDSIKDLFCVDLVDSLALFATKKLRKTSEMMGTWEFFHRRK